MGKLRGLIGRALPEGLAPVIGLIEVVSLAIRPVTLGLRLAANMMAGHIIMGLMMGAMVGFSVFVSLLVLPGVVGICLFELAVGVVQAYVFILLFGIYVREWVGKA